MAQSVDTYLKAVVEHDWEAFALCVADDVVRVGPFGDTYTPKAPYVEYISKLMPTLENYSMKVDRIVDNGDVVLVELTETLDFGGKTHVTPEALVFDINSEGLISKVDIFIKRLPS
jgi:ketosteroid isomerase-like protein